MLVRFLLCAALMTTAAGCVQTSELALAENVVLIRATGISANWISHMIVAEQLPKQTLQRAAQATIDRGYTHFHIQDGSSQTRYVGRTSQRGQISGSSVMVSGGNPITSTDTMLMVIMYRESDAGARGAFDARFVLKEVRGRRT